MLFIPVLQCNLSGTIESTLHLDDPGRLLQTINIRKIIAVQYKEASWYCMVFIEIPKGSNHQCSWCTSLYNHFLHEQMNTFIHKTNWFHIWTFIFLVFILKIATDTVLLLVLAINIYQLWLWRFFKWFISWNTRFNINRTCIIFFTCNVWICFLIFVSVSTWSVILMLSSSRNQPSNQNYRLYSGSSVITYSIVAIESILE